jgi:hypothetical protein
MSNEIEELHSLADTCREWSTEAGTLREHSHAIAFRHLADQLDAIAKRLAERPLHRDGQP